MIGYIFESDTRRGIIIYSSSFRILALIFTFDLPSMKYVIKKYILLFLEVNVAINTKVETSFWGANVFREGRKIARGGGNISSGGEEIFPPPGDFVMGETLFRDTGT